MSDPTFDGQGEETGGSHGTAPGGAPPPASPQAESRLAESSAGRLVGALVAPGATFRSIAERPTWLLALFVLISLTTVSQFMLAQHIDFAAEAQKRIAQSGQTLSAEQVDQQVALAKRVAPILTVVSGVLIGIVSYLVIAALFWLAFKAVGGEMRFPLSLSVLVHGMMPWTVYTLLAIPVLLNHPGIYNTSEMARLRSNGILASSLAALAPEHTGRALVSLLGSIDLFSFWALALLVVGYRAATRVSKGAAVGVVLSLWVLWVAVKAGLSVVLASFMGAG